MMAYELVVDSFAGGGGASTGIEEAIGRWVDIAINHDPEAIAMHKANHPNTTHYCESVWDVDPVAACKGRPVALAWFSPDCKHFSKAKGGTPVEKKVRGLAWVAVRWAKRVRPRVIILENVEEFKTWGPLTEDNKPDPERKGETFNLFIKTLEKLGYEVKFKELRACDFGAPTTRKRLFIIARCDGQPIVWPEPTHGDPESQEVKSGLLKPWRTAAEIIDWSLKCPSIFTRKKKLAENTERRVFKGLKKFVLSNPQPYIVQIGQTGFASDNRTYSVEEPLTTIVTKAEHCLATPYLTSYHSETTNEEVRAYDVRQPIHTLDTSNRFGLVAAYIDKYYSGENQGYPVTDPLHTIRTKDCMALVEAHLCVLRNNMDCKDLRSPLPTITTSPGHFAVVTTVLRKIERRQDLGHWPKIRKLLNKYCGYKIAADEILLLDAGGILFYISDIGLRMLKPHELFPAQGFPETYIIDRDFEGKKYPVKEQVARCGNSVSPPVSAALVRVNLPELCSGKAIGMIG